MPRCAKCEMGNKLRGCVADSEVSNGRIRNVKSFTSIHPIRGNNVPIWGLTHITRTLWVRGGGTL